jgi:hypothetical protein
LTSIPTRASGKWQRRRRRHAFGCHLYCTVQYPPHSWQLSCGCTARVSGPRCVVVRVRTGNYFLICVTWRLGYAVPFHVHVPPDTDTDDSAPSCSCCTLDVMHALQAQHHRETDLPTHAQGMNFEGSKRRRFFQLKAFVQVQLSGSGSGSGTRAAHRHGTV